MCQILFPQSGWPAREQPGFVLGRKIPNKRCHQTPITTTTMWSPQLSASPKKFVINLPIAPQTPAININCGLSKFKPAMNNDPAAIESPKTRKRFGVGWKYPFNLVPRLVCMICVCFGVSYVCATFFLVLAEMR
jgi:hypothetical protein